MPGTESYPFDRVYVNHLFYGVSRIWWNMASDFTDPAPYTFQLQASYTGNNTALDWVDLGAAAINPSYMEDDTVREAAGKRLLTHYRLKLTTDNGVYISAPAPIWGILNQRDWVIAQEITRKEALRHGLVSVAGYLCRRMRYGAKDPRAVDTLTGEVVDSKNRSSWGTAFKVGYHPPVPFSMDINRGKITELRGGGNVAKHSSQLDRFTARVIAFPDHAKEDFWVDEDTDMRYVIHSVKMLASWRGVPLVNEVELALAPFGDIIYRIPISQDAIDPVDEDPEALPTVGDGCVAVNHDYPTDEYLTYQAADCCGIPGVTILVFTQEDWTGGARTAEHAVAVSSTTTNGRWAYSVMLDPGEYVVLFEKPGEYGPDAVALTVQNPDVPPPTVSSSSSVSESFGPV